MSDFVHLHCHTEYSILDGSIKVDALCAKAKDFGMQASAITDHGYLYGAIAFYKACEKEGIKPIIGCEVYVSQDHRDHESEVAKIRHHLILLAKDNDGYKNLVKLVTAGCVDGFYYKPRVDKDLLRKHAEGLICLSACMSGEIPRAIRAGDMDKAFALTREYDSIFHDNFYLELQKNGLEEQERVNVALMEIAEEMRLPLVATNDCHYLEAGDADAHDILLCIQTGTDVNDPERLRFESRDLYYKSVEEMERDFSDVPQALENTQRIADACSVKMTFGQHVFPVYALPEGTDSSTELRRLANAGLEKRLAASPPDGNRTRKDYEDRLALELDVICSLGFADYFLIVQEFINWAKDHRIPVGPGRGSGAGSLVAWALRITNIDPLPYGLLFERFLNSERVSLPDIDVDFCERGREQVIRHVVDTYGEDSVAQITTYNTMKARMVVRDVARALGMPYSEGDRIARLIPMRPIGTDKEVTIERSLAGVPELRRIAETEPAIRRMLDVSMRLEGLVRNASIHASALVVSKGPMTDFLPLYKGRNGETVTQFDGPTVEATGLVKFDFLGLKTMTMIDDTLKNIAGAGMTPPDMDTLPLDDAETYALYARGDTDGVFQVESSGMREYLRQLRPSCFGDIIAMVALYRPGPMDNIPDFIARKHGRARVDLLHPAMADCLRDTYGVIVYQEQVMQLGRTIGGYTLGGADILRRAMGKKKPEVMAAERVKFVSGATGNGIKEGISGSIFDLMEKFASYGFNKSHAAAYALVSYQTAYLKAHYPAEFMAALLTSVQGERDKLIKYLACCRSMHIPVDPPDVNMSREGFYSRDGRIYFGFMGIKGVGQEAAMELVRGRGEGKDFQPYTSLHDMCTRVDVSKISKGAVESLVKSGACDTFGVREGKATRAGMLEAVEEVIARAKRESEDRRIAAQMRSRQASLFAMEMPSARKVENGVGYPCPRAEIPEMAQEDLTAFEKETLGLYITYHPLDGRREDIRRLGVQTLESLQDLPAGTIVECAVLVDACKPFLPKAKEGREPRMMANVDVEDLTGTAHATIFSTLYENCRHLLREGAMLWMRADCERAATDDERTAPQGGERGSGQVKLLVRDVMTLDERVERMKSHPLRNFASEIPRLGLTTLSVLRVVPEGTSDVCAVVVRSVRVSTTRGGRGGGPRQMAFVDVDDMTGGATVTFFPDAFDAARGWLGAGSLLWLRVEKEAPRANGRGKPGQCQLKVKDVALLESKVAQCSEPVVIDIPGDRTDVASIGELRRILEGNPGDVPVRAVVNVDGYRCVLRLEDGLRIRPGKALNGAIAAWSGRSAA
ncbi:MAG: DNA polymerase III subunit alpha [Desulfovibrio sp.]|jgi:DNA polymerase-3 subunit alpha|nr:DNA polymerase III subunit alpha [Desulfovibrio sp.]